MAIPLARKVLIDTNVLIDYLRDDLSAEWVFGGTGLAIRFLSSIVLMEIGLRANTPKRRRAVDRIRAAFPDERVVAPSPDLFLRAAFLFRRLYGGGGERTGGSPGPHQRQVEGGRTAASIRRYLTSRLKRD